MWSTLPLERGDGAESLEVDQGVVLEFRSLFCSGSLIGYRGRAVQF